MRHRPLARALLGARLVGRRFAFDTLKPVKGEDGDRLNCFVWRVTGAPAPSYNDAYAEVQAHWLGDDALAENDALCEALEAAAAERDVALARRLEAEEEMFLRAQRKEAKRYVRAAFSDTSTRAKFSVMLRSHHDACRV